MNHQTNSRPYWLINSILFSRLEKKLRLFIIGCCVTLVNVKQIITAPILSSSRGLGQIQNVYNALKNKYSNHIHQFQAHSKTQ